MYRRVLVPLDGSKRAELVIPHVIELARGRDTLLLLLRVVEPPITPASAVTPVATSAASQLAALEDSRRRAEKEARTYLKQLKAKLETDAISCEVLLAYGRVVQGIAHAAAAYYADLIALTSHGRTALASVFMGSVAVGVIHCVERPVLLVRSSSSEEAPRFQFL